MATASHTIPEGPTADLLAPHRVPILHNGDRLDADEFERRYRAMPYLKKAELIGGRVHIPSPDFHVPDRIDPFTASPVSLDGHANPHFNAVGWLGIYCGSTPGLKGGDNGTIRLGLENVPQPDAFLFLLPSHGGQARISADDYLVGAPELVLEISRSTVSYDLHEKLEAYQRNRAQEYIVWRVEQGAIDWFVLIEGRYERLGLDAEGHFRSVALPGLRLDPAALIRGDLATVFRVAQEGLASPEHAEFVARLRKMPRRRPRFEGTFMATVTQILPEKPPIDSIETEEIPPLESGDRLTSAEFERRYHAMPPHVRAELVEGVVYVSSPVSVKHGKPHLDLSVWVGLYKIFTPGVGGASDGTVRLDLDNQPQPDLQLHIAASHGGRIRISEDDYYVGAPELVVEIAASTASYDLHDKLNAYRRNEVLEYIVWRVRNKAVDWFLLREGQYERMPPSADGILRSVAFPGLWLDPAAVLRDDMSTVFRVAQEGINSPEHAAFVARLQEHAAKAAST